MKSRSNILSCWEIKGITISYHPGDAEIQRWIDGPRTEKKDFPTLVLHQLLQSALEHRANYGRGIARSAHQYGVTFRLNKIDWLDLVCRTVGRESSEHVFKDLTKPHGPLGRASQQKVLWWAPKPLGQIAVTFARRSSFIKAYLKSTLTPTGKPTTATRGAGHRVSYGTWSSPLNAIFPRCWRMAHRRNGQRLNTRVRHLQLEWYSMVATGAFDVSPQWKRTPALKAAMDAGDKTAIDAALATHPNFQTPAMGLATLALKTGYSRRTLQRMRQEKSLSTTSQLGMLVMQNASHKAYTEVGATLDALEHKGLRCVESKASSWERSHAIKNNQDIEFTGNNPLPVPPRTWNLFQQLPSRHIARVSTPFAWHGVALTKPVRDFLEGLDWPARDNIQPPKIEACKFETPNGGNRTFLTYKSRQLPSTWTPELASVLREKFGPNISVAGTFLVKRIPHVGNVPRRKLTGILTTAGPSKRLWNREGCLAQVAVETRSVEWVKPRSFVNRMGNPLSPIKGSIPPRIPNDHNIDQFPKGTNVWYRNIVLNNVNDTLNKNASATALSRRSVLRVGKANFHHSSDSL